MNIGQPTLLEGLLGDAFEQFGQATPTMVSARSVDGAAGGVASSYEIPFSWPERVIHASAELGSAVSEQLAAGPVLFVPPWGRRADSRDQLSRNEHEAAILDCVPADPDSLLAVLLPASTWISRQAQPVREKLAKRWRPVLLIYAAGVLPGIHPSFLLAAAFLRPKAAQESLLRLFRVPARPDPSAVTEDFRRLLKRSGGRGQFGYVLRERPSPGDSLAFDRHDPAVAAKKAELSVLGTAVTVDEMFDLVWPGIHRSDNRDLRCDDAVPGASRIVSGRDLRRDGTLAPADESVEWALIPPDQQLKAGDILLPRIFGASDQGGLRAVEMTDADLPAAGSDVVVTLRPKEPLTAPERILILGFLRSRLARDLTAASTDGSMQLTWAALRELHIPQPDEALITALEDLVRAATLFEGWRSEAQALLESVFADDSAAGTRARIVSSGRNIRLRSDAAALLDDAGYTFRTRFPYPVAYRWREVEAAESARSFKTAYEAILAAAEVLLCYAANVGLAVARETGIHLGAVKMIHDKLQNGGSGLGFGDWTAVLNQIRDSKAVRTVPGGNPITELRALLANSGTEAAVQRLSARRNDESHLRRAGSPDLPAAVDISKVDLTTLYQAASFLSDLPLIHVTAVHWDSFRRLATVSYRELMGDHPVVPTRTITYAEPDIEVGSVYIVDGQRRLCLLRPFVTGRICPKCGIWSTFHIDGSVEGKVTYKSLEHGHAIEDVTLDDSLRHVGLLLFPTQALRSLQHGELDPDAN